MKKILIPVCILLLAACYNDKEDQLYPQPTATTGCDTNNLSFATDIQPIMNQYCAIPDCHDAITKSFFHDLSNYDGVKKCADGGRMIPSIKQESGYLPMPKGMNKLGDCEISRISAWVNAGMPQ
ncbi:MAG: hypothetical protein KDC07_07385 [Chitinophagaceae bacterium]|nr:hypothetical protein [Chitinophagaceae bacterium]MCB9047256.1 hypothetical protein [Chitinophagales bacterium]